MLTFTGCVSQNKPQESLTGTTTPVPEEYLSSSTEPGNVIDFSYKTTDNSGEEINKSALVYLPFNYDSNQNYNVLYLVHGLGSNKEFFFENENLLNTVDNMIKNKNIQPLIIVSATFDPNDEAQDLKTSTQEIRSFYKEIRDDLIPAVESNFSTYATDTTPEGIIKSRNHRAFGGFSLGSSATWNEFLKNPDYFYYYLPMSGAAWFLFDQNYFVEDIVEELNKSIEENNLNNLGYFIYATTANNDSFYEPVNEQLEEMLNRQDIFNPENLAYFIKEDGSHNIDSVTEYLYNALPLFFKV